MRPQHQRQQPASFYRQGPSVIKPKVTSSVGYRLWDFIKQYSLSYYANRQEDKQLIAKAVEKEVIRLNGLANNPSISVHPFGSAMHMLGLPTAGVDVLARNGPHSVGGVRNLIENLCRSLRERKVAVKPGSSFDNVRGWTDTNRLTARWNAPTRKTADDIELSVCFLNDRRYLWNAWWLKELGCTYLWLGPVIRIITLWAEARGLVGDGRRGVLSGPVIQLMVIHVAMEAKLLCPMDERTVSGVRSRQEKGDKERMESPRAPVAVQAQIVNRLVRRFFRYFREFEFEFNCVQMEAPIVRRDNPPDHERPRGKGVDRRHMDPVRIYDAWGVKKEVNPAPIATVGEETGRNVAAGIKTRTVIQYFTACCEDTNEKLDTISDQDDREVQPSQLGLSDTGSPLEPIPELEKILKKGSALLYTPQYPGERRQ
jgi:hypothetical protein